MLYIEKLYSEMKSRGFEDEYIEICVSYSRELLNNKVPVIFDGEHLAKLLGVNFSTLSYYVYDTNKFYQEFKIPKKTGDFRIIEAPSLNLKRIQSWILENILENITISESAYGFRKGINIVHNAQKHTFKKVVYNIDIKDFFPSIKRKDIFYIFYNRGYTSEVSYILSKLLTYKEHLPHGAPSSPYLANIKCEKLDFSIRAFCERIGAHYTRYADDITISCNNKKLIDNFLVIKKIIQNNGFELNEKKERIQYENQMQEVTGLIVNNGVKVKRRYKREIEKDIYFCKKYGVSGHLKQINKNYLSFYREYLYGKVNFVKMVEPEVAATYLEQLAEIDWLS